MGTYHALEDRMVGDSILLQGEEEVMAVMLDARCDQKEWDAEESADAWGDGDPEILEGNWSQPKRTWRLLVHEVRSDH